MLRFLFGFVLLLPVIAFARTGDNEGAWADYQEIGAMDNCNNDAINSAVVCGDTFGVKTEGYNIATFEIKYTKGAGTGYQFYLQGCNEGHSTSDCTNAADWHTIAIEQVIPGTGVALTTDLIYHDAAASDQLTWSIGINYRRIRLSSFVAKGTPNTSDKITVYLRLVKTHAF